MKACTHSILANVTFHVKTCYNGFPFRTRLKEIYIRLNDLGHPFKKICIRSNGLITRSIETSSRSNDLLTRLVKASIRSNDLLTRSIKTSNRSNDLLTRLLKTSNRLNDLLTRSLEHPSVQTTWVWDSHTSGCLFLFAYSCSWWCHLRKKSPPITWTVWTAAGVNYKWKLRYCKLLAKLLLHRRRALAENIIILHF